MCLQRWEGLSTLGLDGENKLPGTLCQGDASKTEERGWGWGVGGRRLCQAHISSLWKELPCSVCPILCDPMDCSPQAPLSMGFSRQEHWSGLPCPPLGDLHDPGIEDQGSNLCLLHWQVDSSPLSHQESPDVFYYRVEQFLDFPGGTSGKEPTCLFRRYKRWVRFLSREDPLKEGMATYSSILAWRIPWTEEPVGYSPWGHKSQTRLRD